MKIRWCFIFRIIHKYMFILFYNFIKFIILLYTFSVISFAWCKKFVIWLISFSKFLDVLHTFTCARAISNLWSICIGVNILSWLRSEALAIRPKWVKSKGCPFPWNIPFWKPWRCSCLPLKSLCAFLKVNTVLLLCLGSLASYIIYINRSCFETLFALQEPTLV